MGDVTHSFVSPVTDEGDPDLVGPDEWNDVHDVTLTASDVGAAPNTGVDYLVGTASGSLTGEIVAGTSPGGELGGTWGSPTVDATHSGSAHTDFIAKAYLDAKGDLISASAADTPSLLAVGSRGSSLFANTAAASGLAWVQAQFQAEAFGAVGDGSTNNTTAIQAAVDAAFAAGGGWVTFGEGTFMVNSQVDLKSNVYLRGSGINATVLKSGASSQNVVELDDTASNMGLFDMTVDGNKTGFGGGSASTVVCAGDSDDLWFVRVRFQDPQSFGLFLDNTTVGGYNRIRALDCEWVGSASTSDLFGSGSLNHLLLSRCIFRDSASQGFATTDSDHIIIEGCTFTGVGNAISLEPAQNVTIRGCTFFHLDDGAIGVKATPVAAVSSVDPQNLLISGNRFYNTGTVPSTYFDHAIVVDNASDVVISDNLISRMGRTGIRIRCQSVSGSAGVVRNVIVDNNEVIDINQDNAAGIGNSTGISFENNLPGTFEKVRASLNKCIKIGSDSHITHGIRETGAVNGAEYLFNDLRGVATAAVTTDTGTGSVSWGNSTISALAYPDHSVLTNLTSGDPHTQYLLESLVDAKGDVLTATADNTPARLAVGANDTVLTADSTQATGLKWATPAAGSTSFASITKWAVD